MGGGGASLTASAWLAAQLPTKKSPAGGETVRADALIAEEEEEEEEEEKEKEDDEDDDDDDVSIGSASAAEGRTKCEAENADDLASIAESCASSSIAYTSGTAEMPNCDMTRWPNARDMLSVTFSLRASSIVIEPGRQRISCSGSECKSE